MVLLLYQDLADLFRHCVFPKRFTLPDAIAVIANGFIFIVEIVPEYILRNFRRAYRLRSDCRHFAEIVNLSRDDQGMIELLLGVFFKLSRNVHVLGAGKHLRINHVGDDGLIFASQVFIQQLGEAVAGKLGSGWRGFELSHLDPPFGSNDRRGLPGSGGMFLRRSLQSPASPSPSRRKRPFRLKGSDERLVGGSGSTGKTVIGSWTARHRVDALARSADSDLRVQGRDL